MNTTTDSYAGNIPEKISGHVLRDLSQVSLWRALPHIAFEWLAIGAAIAVSEWIGAWYGYLAAIVWIGARQHALAILMHEGTHYRIAANRKLNDIVSELFLAAPIFISLRDYRENHFSHHRYVNTNDDPDWIIKQNDDWAFPKTKLGFLKLFLADLFALRTKEHLTGVVFPLNVPPKSWREFWTYHVWRILFYLVAFSIIFGLGLGWQFLVYWLVPFFTVLKLIFRLRSVAEHFGIENESAYSLTRTTYPRLWERLLLAPKNVSYHLDHHLYPSVPFYNLPKLHAALLALPEFRKQAHLTQSYVGVLRECIGAGQKKAAAPEDR